VNQHTAVLPMGPCVPSNRCSTEKRYNIGFESIGALRGTQEGVSTDHLPQMRRANPRDGIGAVKFQAANRPAAKACGMASQQAKAAKKP
jgi:hypothetical protein